jgi:hypothetical protein
MHSTQELAPTLLRDYAAADSPRMPPPNIHEFAALFFGDQIRDHNLFFSLLFCADPQVACAKAQQLFDDCREPEVDRNLFNVIYYFTMLDTKYDWCRKECPRAKVAELVDAQASGACARKGVGVRVPPFANEPKGCRGSLFLFGHVSCT